MRQPTKLSFIRNTFLTGLLILLPLVVTYVLVTFLIEWLSGLGALAVKGLFGPLKLDRFWWIDPLGPIVNFCLSVVIIFLLGLFGTNIVGKRILAAIDALLLRVPLVRSIYGAVQQMVETFQGPGRSFQRVVLLQYPSKGLWMMGLVAAEWPDTLRLVSSAEKLLTVFIPTTPNPTSGFLVLVSPEDVVELDYSVEEAFKFIVSAGIVGKPFVPRPDLPEDAAPLEARSLRLVHGDSEVKKVGL
ncbi:MAG: DUF502 domain-containing protein [Thermodesulfobacteriota bacterium]|jgi:uncharacterized membrane protein